MIPWKNSIFKSNLFILFDLSISQEHHFKSGPDAARPKEGLLKALRIGKKTEKTHCDPTDSNANAFFLQFANFSAIGSSKCVFHIFFLTCSPKFSVFPWHLPGLAQRLGSSWPTHLVLSQDLAYWGLTAFGGEVPSGTGQIWFILMAYWWHIDGILMVKRIG